MIKIIQKFPNKINGVLSTFDRMIYKGHIRQFFSQSGKMYFLSKENILLKDFASYAEKVTANIKSTAKLIADESSRPYHYLNSSKISKEKTALSYLENAPIDNGLICVLSTVETCSSIDIVKNHETGHIELKNRDRKCLYLYFYYLDSEFGFMHVKLQTWFPFEIQIYINGREYLSKQLDKEGISYTMYDNCFTHIDDIEKAQKLADKIESKKLSSTFDQFAYKINPMLKRISEVFSQGYYWCLDQCEYATDVMFKSREELEEIYPDLVEHALISFKSEDVMTFLGRKMHAAFQGEVVSDIKKRPTGVRIKHRMQNNCIKMYDKYSVLRVETTINDPHEFKIYKEVTCKGEKVKKWVPMGKSISNMYRYAQVSEASNKRYLDAISLANCKGEYISLIEKVCEKVEKDGRKYTGFNLLSKNETGIFLSILDGRNHINGFTNISIRKSLYSKNQWKDKKICNKITRLLAKMRAHGLIGKIPHSFRYKVTEKGIKVMSAILQIKKRDLPGFLKVS